MLQFVCADAGRASFSDCRMCRALQTSAKRKRQLDQAAALGIERASLVTKIAKLIKCLPDFWVFAAKLIYCLR